MANRLVHFSYSWTGSRWHAPYLMLVSAARTRCEHAAERLESRHGTRARRRGVWCSFRLAFRLTSDFVSLAEEMPQANAPIDAPDIQHCQYQPGLTPLPQFAPGNTSAHFKAQEKYLVSSRGNTHFQCCMRDIHMASMAVIGRMHDDPTEHFCEFKAQKYSSAF